MLTSAVCEDHPVSRMVMERLLEKLDCRCMSVENGPDAIRCTMGAVKCMAPPSSLPTSTNIP